jgi:membrane protein
MKKFSLKLVWTALKKSFKGFSDDKITKLSASLAYYTVFSLAPLLIMLIFLSSIFLGREAVEGGVMSQLQGFIGADAAKQIEDMIKNASISDKGGMAAVIGVITLLIGASTVFGEIQDSINGIWGLKPKPKAGFGRLIKSRLLSFGMIGSLGFLLLVSLAATSAVETLGKALKAYLPDTAVEVFYVINLVLNLAVTTTLFGVIFKVLPDIKIKWKDIWPGAIATSLLFLIGKFAISLYISKSEIGSTYGAAGSLVVLLVWIYYSSVILYFGAEFTKFYALEKGAKIVPEDYATWNRESTVPGAVRSSARDEQKNQGPAKEQQRRTPAPMYSLSSRKGKDPGKKEPGMGTVMLGLALFFITGSDKR